MNLERLRRELHFIHCHGSRYSHRSRRPAKSTLAAAILVASEAVDEIVLLKEAYTVQLGSKVKNMVLVDSKDLSHALSSKRNTVDKTARTDVNLMWLYFETSIDVFACIPAS